MLALGVNLKCINYSLRSAGVYFRRRIWNNGKKCLTKPLRVYALFRDCAWCDRLWPVCRFLLKTCDNQARQPFSPSILHWLNKTMYRLHSIVPVMLMSACPVWHFNSSILSLQFYIVFNLPSLASSNQFWCTGLHFRKMRFYIFRTTN